MQFSPELRSLQAQAREFARQKLLPRSMEAEWLQPAPERVPWDLVEEASRMGFRTIAAPKQYGGGGADPLTLCVLVEELARGDMGVAVIFDQTWKITRIFSELANEQQKKWFFDRFIPNHRSVLAITFTEPEHASDYIIPYSGSHFETTAVRDGDGWLLNGRKHFISNGADADVYLVFACTDPSKGIREGSSAFIVPREAVGFTRVRIHEKMGQRTINNGELRFENVRLPDWALLGQLNAGMTNSAHVLKESAVEAGATTLGSAQGAYDQALQWCKTRIQGGKPLIEHANVQISLAKMLGKLEAARSLIYRAAWHATYQEPYDYKWGSLAKTFASDISVEVAMEAMELQGGHGYMLENPAQKYLRDCLSFLHSDGTQDAHRLRIGNYLQAE